ncbi:hypothetical protein QJ857_gp0023 [Tupanvirus soda lake]|uniref:Uncharacterized protein n=2 Tax=Tupanvirus TaxID=2094720 RepID=A0A6N1NWK1_9VIRU|nr:hypothetical protein QJ857_gp0023 [Tupanvirus soda lake]QKU34672.1 hypothetical protein [Tupanvirus soda lake]
MYLNIYVIVFKNQFLINKSYLLNINMSNAQKINTNDDKDSINESFFQYSFEIFADMALGIVLGISVNVLSDFIAKTLKLPRFGLIIVQFILICLVLYVMKIDSKYLYESWKGQTSYGIVFTAVFLAVQKNLIRFFEDIYVEEKMRIGI